MNSVFLESNFFVVVVNSYGELSCLVLNMDKLMRIVEALEGKGFRMPLMKDEAELADKLAIILRQVSLSPIPPTF